MLTPKISGIFDCRKYDQSGKKAHDQREMLADSDNITFGALFLVDQGVPEVFFTNGKLDEVCRPKASKREREAASRENREAVLDSVSVKFKIGSNCKWFDRYAKPCDRPTNAELEASRWNVQLDFTKKEKDPTKPLSPSGYWVNAIMISPIEQNPFAGQAFDASEPEPANAQTHAQTAQDEEDSLPFD